MVTDSLSTVFALASTRDALTFNSARLRYLWSRQVLTLDTNVTTVLEDRAIAALSHAYTMILRFNFVPVGRTLQRTFQLGKLKSGEFTASQHEFTIVPRTGIVTHRTRG